MGFGVFLILLSAISASWVTWVFTARINDRKIARYSNIVTQFDQQNAQLRRQFDEMKQSLEKSLDNPQLENLERDTNELIARRENVITIVKNLRKKIVEKYENYPLGKFVLDELENISPSEKMLENQRLQQAQMAFRRIQSGMK